MTDWDGCRWDGRSGHYESWFQRANHPIRPLAFWIRHTIFCPAGRPDAAEGELWGVWFDGEKGRNVAVKAELPMRDCVFGAKGLEVKLPGAKLGGHVLDGGTGVLAWKLGWAPTAPSLLYPEGMYEGSFPKAKALSCAPNTKFSGTVTVHGETHRIEEWPGSHNHNWGSQHHHRYAWAQVNGFDNAPDVFLECGTAQLKLGPVTTPQMTVAVLRLGDRQLVLNTVPRALAASARIDGFTWNFSNAQAGAELKVAIDAPKERFVALKYRNPPGGIKACLNSKLASCTVTLKENGKSRTLTSANRAAFELLCEEDDPRVGHVGGFSA
jgi:hypothetical protein